MQFEAKPITVVLNASVLLASIINERILANLAEINAAGQTVAFNEGGLFSVKLGQLTGGQARSPGRPRA